MFSMEDSTGRGDDDYGTSLQRIMQQCLPPILVELADRRPLDPIHHMAQCLYTYREKEERECSQQIDSSSGDSQISRNTHKSTNFHHGASSKVTQPSQHSHKAGNLSQTHGVSIIKGEEEFYEFTDNLQNLSLSNKLVHTSTQSVIQTIGDLFDDDDFS